MACFKKRINDLSLWLATRGNKVAAKSASRLAEGIIPIDHPPENSPDELQAVISQHRNNFSPKIMENDLDERFENLFDEILIENGRSSSLAYIKELSQEVVPAVKALKKFFNRKRPSEYALELGIKWSGDDSKMKTVDSPSYPSGHTTQAYFIALKLAEIHHDLSEELLELAELISQSRVDRGVHYQSDIDAGKILAKHLFES